MSSCRLLETSDASLYLIMFVNESEVSEIEKSSGRIILLVTYFVYFLKGDEDFGGSVFGFIPVVCEYLVGDSA